MKKKHNKKGQENIIHVTKDSIGRCLPYTIIEPKMQKNLLEKILSKLK